MNRPTKEDVLEYFGNAQRAADYIGMTRQGIEVWADGPITEKAYRLLLGSFTRQRDAIPKQFQAPPKRKN